MPDANPQSAVIGDQLRWQRELETSRLAAQQQSPEAFSELGGPGGTEPTGSPKGAAPQPSSAANPLRPGADGGSGAGADGARGSGERAGASLAGAGNASGGSSAGATSGGADGALQTAADAKGALSGNPVVAKKAAASLFKSQVIDKSVWPAFLYTFPLLQIYWVCSIVGYEWTVPMRDEEHVAMILTLVVEVVLLLVLLVVIGFLTCFTDAFCAVQSVTSGVLPT